MLHSFSMIVLVFDGLVEVGLKVTLAVIPVSFLMMKGPATLFLGRIFPHFLDSVGSTLNSNTTFLFVNTSKNSIFPEASLLALVPLLYT